MATESLIAALADGHFHSGEALAASAGVTRGAIWKQIAKLAALGIEVERVPGRGYRVTDGLDLLDGAAVRAALPAEVRGLVHQMDVLRSTPSTNSHLMERSASTHCQVCLAEHQSAGRGRMGRRWVSPFGANLYLSVAWTFDALPPGIQTLALAAACAAADALDPTGDRGVQIKWPNDLVVDDRKLGGILVELRGEPPGRSRAVVGVGINVRMPASAADAVDQPWIDLAALGVAPLVRSTIAAQLIAAEIVMLEDFARHGFGSFRERWLARDALRDRAVTVASGDGEQVGIARGIDGDGALKLETAAGPLRVLAGEVSVRARLSDAP